MLYTYDQKSIMKRQFGFKSTINRYSVFVTSFLYLVEFLVFFKPEKENRQILKESARKNTISAPLWHKMLFILLFSSQQMGFRGARQLAAGSL